MEMRTPPGRRLLAFWLAALTSLYGAPEPAGAQEGRDADERRVSVTPAAGSGEHLPLAPLISAVRLDGATEIEVDGRLDEAVWERAPTATDFLQRQPAEGLPATQRTEVRFVYDGETLYIGARMYDELGAEGVTSRLARRDASTRSDELVFIFDPFHDHQGQVRFSINPAGVRGDAWFGDDSWDPVWRARTRIDSLGWTAELAIPFSQLRFPSEADQLWGLQIQRVVHRLNEVSVWSFWRLSEQGGPARYGHLDGLSDIEARTTRLELLPYAVTRLDANGTANPNDPFTDDTEASYRVGADLRYLLTSNLTLSATLNPDFGQVEVDPAVVNLSAFETFFPEKREFFIEGRENFAFGNLWCFFCSNVSSLSTLFTRRIGRAPGAASLARGAGEFADVPGNSTILGAAKITGKTATGTSIGVLNALTRRESAPVVDAEGNRFVQEVEPFTNYFVARAKQDLADGNLQVGAIATSVVRDFDDPALESLMNRHAESLGLDAEYWWGDRTYHLLFQSAFTNIAGSPDAVQRAQRSSARYLHRPDREGGSNGLFTGAFDPTLTSMRGWGMYSRVAKDAGDWRWETMLNVRSPGFENNDLAFLTRADYVWMNGNVLRQWTTPGSWYRSLTAVLGGQQQYNFDGDRTDRQLHGFFHVQTPFYWNANAFFIHRPERLDDRLTRGGPVVKAPTSTLFSAFVGTDDRRPVVAGFNPSYGFNAEGGSELNLRLDLTVKPRSNVLLTLGPSFSRLQSVAHYVTAVDDPTAEHFFGRRYVFAELDQNTIGMTTRLDVTFTPGMSLEMFLQPLISANDFRRFKEFDAPRELSKSVYGVDVGTVTEEIREVDGRDVRFFRIDPDGAGPAEEFEVRNPDFTFRSLRGNLVFRWEYLPGSTLFFVWTQDRQSVEPFGDLDFGRDRSALLSGPTDHVFLVKLTYWLGL